MLLFFRFKFLEHSLSWFHGNLRALLPPQCHPRPRNKAVWRDYSPSLSFTNLLVRPNFLGGVSLGPLVPPWKINGGWTTQKSPNWRENHIPSTSFLEFHVNFPVKLTYDIQLTVRPWTYANSPHKKKAGSSSNHPIFRCKLQTCCSFQGLSMFSILF